MKNILDQNIYKKVSNIQNIKFTKREIDLIACILSNRGEKKIASILNISKNTVSTHVRNILIKLNVNSKEYIIDFIQKSGLKKLFLDHYENLLYSSLFTQTLTQIRNELLHHKICCYVEKHNQIDNNLSEYVISLLRNTGIIVVKNKTNQYPNHTITFCNNIDPSNKELKKIYIVMNSESVVEDKRTAVYFKDRNEYFHSFLELVKLICPMNSKIIKIVDKFKKEAKLYDYDEVNYKTENKKIAYSFLNYKLLVSIIFLILFFMMLVAENDNDAAIYFDPPLPSKSFFLSRKEKIDKIDDLLKRQNSQKYIPIVNIVGIGGAGKTTIARYYAAIEKNASIIWEINAETKESLIQSFKKLSYRMANTNELRKELDLIEAIKDSELQESELLNFIKTKLLKKDKWLLIYDNLESFSQINHYFPREKRDWGDGKIIITTRNNNLKDSISNVNNETIYINELSSSEARNLLSNILYDRKFDNLNEEQITDIKHLLENIPLYPLDIALAGHYIKNTNNSSKLYLQNIANYSKQYDRLQSSILKETIDYDKTRFGIISSSLEKIISKNYKFTELLFLISILDSQNMPYGLFANYSDHISIDTLIYEMNQKGILIRKNLYSNNNKNISIHRSTHAATTLYILNKIPNNKKIQFLDNIIYSLNQYYKHLVENEDIKSVFPLLVHIESALNNIQKLDIAGNLKLKYMANLHILLGYANYTGGGNILSMQQNFIKAFEINEKLNVFSNKQMAVFLKDLGKVTVWNSPTLAHEYIRKSIEICNKDTKLDLIKAKNYIIQAHAYHRSYSNIKDNFELSNRYLKKALKILKQNPHLDEEELIAKIHFRIALLHVHKYLNRKEAESSIDMLENFLASYKDFKYYHNNKEKLPQKITCEMAERQWEYSEILFFYKLDYKESEEWVKSANYILQNKCPHNLFLKGRIHTILGDILLRQNKLVDADKNVSEAIKLLSKVVGHKGYWTELITRAEIRIRSGDYQGAIEDCKYVMSLKDAIENSTEHITSFLRIYHHMAVAYYNLGDYKNSIENFEKFIINMQEFCRGFLYEEEYDELDRIKAFSIYKNNKMSINEKIRIYSQNTYEIAVRVYSLKNTIVPEYFTKTIFK